MKSDDATQTTDKTSEDVDNSRSTKKESTTQDWSTLRWLFKNFRPLIGAMIFAMIGETVASANDVLFAFCMRDVVDSAVLGDRSRLFWASAASVGLLVWALIVSLFNQFVIERIRARAEVELQSRTLRQFLRKDYSATSERHSGDVLNRLTSDVKVVCDNFSTTLPLFSALISRLVFAFAALCYFDWRFASFFLFAGLAVFSSTRFFRRFLKKLHKRVQEAEGRKRAFWQEILENLLAVKTFSRETLVEKKSQTLQKEHFNAAMRRRNFNILANGGFYCLFSFGYLFALIWCAFKLCAGAMSFGVLTAILQLVGKVQSPFVSLSGILPRYFAALASAERIRELEELPNETGSDVPGFSGSELFEQLESIVFENVSFRYRREEKEVAVLENASFELRKGANVVFCGRSGIGKSSVFKLLTGVCQPASGTIYLKMRGGEKIPVDVRTRRLFATVPQGNLLFSGTIRENLAFFRDDLTDEELCNALRIAGAEFVENVPDKLDAKLGQNGLGLSEGQIQRLAIARAVLSDAPILLLDESTSALDVDSEANVLKNLKNESKKTLFIVSHRPAAFKIVDLVAEFAEKQVDVYDSALSANQ